MHQLKTPKPKIARKAPPKNNNAEFVVRTGATFNDSVRIKRAEITAERGTTKHWSLPTKTQLGHANLPLLDAMRELKIVGLQKKSPRKKNC